jgi:(S)-ureidoglycine aminohydrolase
MNSRIITRASLCKNPKWLWSLIALSLCAAPAFSQQPPIASDVYVWKDLTVERTETGSRRSIAKGSATDFEVMDISATTLEKGKTDDQQAHPDLEEMIIVKDGNLQITINGESKTVGRGSVAIIMPGDEHKYANAADGDTTYYVLRYKSRKPADAERTKTSGGSFVMDWNDVKFSPRSDGKGGTRSFFTKTTAMGKRLELHSTRLEPNQNSHSPHRHRAEEMVIILDADTEMYLGPAQKDGKTKKATDGDVIYLVSNEYHAISNIGQTAALYFAFQFE